MDARSRPTSAREESIRQPGREHVPGINITERAISLAAKGKWVNRHDLIALLLCVVVFTAILKGCEAAFCGLLAFGGFPQCVGP
jgi:hypothetical protein